MLHEEDALLLINKTHPLAPGWEETVRRISIISVRGLPIEVEETTLAAWESLKDDMAARGMKIGILSAYRSREEQVHTIERLTKEFGPEYAAATAAPVGASEHHTGLCLDITMEENGAWVIGNMNLMAAEEAYLKIHARLAEHGFILRYPRGKEAITGYGYEPWHIRYVGKKAAKEIADSGRTLEEYLQKK